MCTVFSIVLHNLTLTHICIWIITFKISYKIVALFTENYPSYHTNDATTLYIKEKKSGKISKVEFG